MTIRKTSAAKKKKLPSKFDILEIIFAILFGVVALFFFINFGWFLTTGDLLFFDAIIPQDYAGTIRYRTFADFRSLMFGLAGAVRWVPCSGCTS